ncbi:MBL fold metallo-hydrolase [Sandaracinus amylolyticus]|uniref:Metallo-beta-lactamase family protein n=1 Tax=Sandaracinus amylolyticus TaxID=927083 RepID=A0A0F6W4G1_9BACT|nr:MBL fold metallo-hydrolase [Sandaracinus amylolyticus]AKF07046.1 Metallo-beta-lactamase family protein [Sandaracinus amylolyticus]
MPARVVIDGRAILLARRDDLPLGERWDLPRDGDTIGVVEQRDELVIERVESASEHPVAPPLAWHTLDALRAQWGRAEIALTADAASVVRGIARDAIVLAPIEGETSIEIAPSLRMIAVRTPTLPPAQHTNLFVIGSRDAVLIEPATPDRSELDRVAEWVGALEATGITLRAIAATHHHVDHVSGARALRDALAAPLVAHPETARRTPRGITFEPSLADGSRIVLDGGEPITLRAVLTPGHAPGHLCFLDERSGALIAGDMIAGVGTILVEPGDGDMALYLESLRRLAALDARAIVPAHGGVMRPPGIVLERYVEHRLARERRVLDALTAHATPARPGDLLPMAYADAPRSAWPLAALSTEAHLIKLEHDGRAKRTERGWVAV